MKHTIRTVVVLSTAVLCACAAQPPLQNVALKWTPSADASFGVVEASRHQFSFDTFKDMRPQPELIAENREKAIPRQVTTQDDVGAFVRTHMREMFARGGLTTVDSGGDVIVSGEVRQFFVEETDTYKANVVLHVTVRNRQGAALWEGQVSGASSTFGRSYSMENYNQVLSNSIIDASATLLKDPDFRNAVMKE